MTMKSHAKFEEKLTCGLENDIRNLANFHQNTWKGQKLVLSWDPFAQSRTFMSQKFIEELCVMTMRNDEKSDEELKSKV